MVVVAAAAASAVPVVATAALPVPMASDVTREGPVAKRADAVSESHQSYGQAVFVLAESGNQNPGPGSVA